ncbi:unnamed protein product [Angiostrongylus costaricensis]|uniref:MATH domain-containing protein n=1 Tax=Angiostrongylus costaricensis TaxID=334426 RepID=A0A0R3PC50_ANGCS|nr:unnamed protein product [Angiostrongylus costaricensis]
MFIYVKFLIEVNRLRSMIKDRMSQSGKKYFEPLLKIAEENQKQASQATAPKESTKSLKVAKLEKVIASSKLNAMSESDGCIDDNDKGQQRIIINKNTRSCGLSSPDKSRSSPAQMSAMVRLDESDSNKVTPKSSSKRLKAENIDKGEEMVSKNSVREMMPKTTVQNSIPVQKDLKTPGKTNLGTQKFLSPELITTDPLRKSASCETINTLTNITSLVNRRLHSTDNLLEKPAVSLTSAAAENKSISAEQPTLRTENKPKRSKHEKKPLSADSTAARTSHQTTAGALRKKEKGDENLAIITQPPLVSSTQPTTLSASLPKKQADSDVSIRPQEAPSETKPISPRPGSSIHERLLKLNACVAPISVNVVSDSKQHRNDPKKARKPEKNLDKLGLKKSDTETSRTATSCEASTITRNTISDKVPVPSKIGSVIDGKIFKIDNGALRPAIHVTSDLNRQQKIIQETEGQRNGNTLVHIVVYFEEAQSQTKLEEQKKSRVLPMTMESKTTTTTLTSTSTKKRKTSMEKKVQHVSPGKSVEEVERSATEQDNSNTCQITVIKAEPKGVPKARTFTMKNVMKEESVRSTDDKERIEEKNTDSKKKKRTTRSAVVKTADKVTIGGYSELGGKPTKLGPTGTKNVFKKMSEHSEVDNDAEGKPATNTETVFVEKGSTKPSESMSHTLETISTIPVTVTKSTTVELHRTDNVATAKKKRSTITGTSEERSQHIPRDDFSFTSLREKLVRRLSTDSEKFSSTVKSQCISIPTVNSVRDRMKRFECRN